MIELKKPQRIQSDGDTYYRCTECYKHFGYSKNQSFTNRVRKEGIQLFVIPDNDLCITDNGLLTMMDKLEHKVEDVTLLYKLKNYVGTSSDKLEQSDTVTLSPGENPVKECNFDGFTTLDEEGFEYLMAALNVDTNTVEMNWKHTMDNTKYVAETEKLALQEELVRLTKQIEMLELNLEDAGQLYSHHRDQLTQKVSSLTQELDTYTKTNEALTQESNENFIERAEIKRNAELLEQQNDRLTQEVIELTQLTERQSKHPIRLLTRFIDYIPTLFEKKIFYFWLVMVGICIQAFHFAHCEFLVSPFDGYGGKAIAFLTGICIELFAFIIIANAKNDFEVSGYLTGFFIIATLVNFYFYDAFGLWENEVWAVKEYLSFALRLVISIAFPYATNVVIRRYIDLLHVERQAKKRT